MTILDKLIVAVVLSAMTAIVSAECPHLDTLRRFYGEKEFLTIEFLQVTHSDIFESVDSIDGTLAVGWAGRFRLTTASQTVVSDGTRYWSYAPENRQVLVDSISQFGQWNPLTLLYDPQRLYRCLGEEKSKGDLTFRMSALDSTTAPRTFTLKVSSAGLAPKYAEFKDEAGSRIEVHVRKFVRHDKLDADLFQFVTPPGVEIIKMP